MSQVILTTAVAPATPPAGKITIYAKADGRPYFKDEYGLETPMRPVGAGSGDLMSDGTIPLTADWDAGLWKITANQLESVVVTGTAPLIIASTTLVANLNADLLDGQEGSYYASVDYVDAAVVGLFDDKGNYDANTNSPDLDTSPSGILKGDVYVVSVVGTFFTQAVEVGDVLRALQDNPTVLAHWAITQANLDAASIKTLYESNADTNAFTDSEKTLLGNQSGTNTGDMSDADVATAYGNEVGQVSGAEKTAGTETALRTFAPKDVADMVGTHTPAGATEFADDVFRVQDNVDDTKEIAFQASGITTATTRTITMPDADVDLGDLATALQPADVLDAVYNNQTGTTYTIQASDAGKIITFNNAASIAVTLPDTLGTNFQCTIVQIGAGVPTVTPNTDTINGAGTGVAPSAQWKAMYLSQYSATNWLAIL